MSKTVTCLLLIAVVIGGVLSPICWGGDPASGGDFVSTGTTPWQPPTEVFQDGIGLHASLAFDQDGFPAMSFYSAVFNCLQFVQFVDGGRYRTEWRTADSVLGPLDEGLYSSLAFDPGGYPAISYYNATEGNLEYRWSDDTHWSDEEVDTTGDTGLYTSLAFDPAGHSAISYYDATNGDLKYASFDGSTWNVQTVDGTGDTGLYTSLAFDPAGHPAISYYDATNGYLKYASFDGSKWNVQTVDSTGDTGLYTSLAFDPAGHPAISYYDATNGDLELARLASASWKTTTIHSTGNVGLYSSLAFDPSGRALMSYQDATNGDLTISSFEDDGYQTNINRTRLITPATDGLYTSLAIDPDGHAAVISYDATFGSLQLNRSDEYNWYAWTPPPAALDLGEHCSLSFDPSGNPGISFFDRDLGGRLGYQHYDGVAWNSDLVDSDDDVGWYTSLAYEPGGKPGISYYDAANGDLRFAMSDGRDWSTNALDVQGNVGLYTSLSFDPAGHPAISYYDATNGDLKFALFDGSTWSVQTVDSTGNTGWDTSLAFDPAGHPAISYYDATNGNLNYASFDGSTWRAQIIDATGDVGRYSSLAFDPVGDPAISYYDATNGNLNYASFDGSWRTQTIDATGDVGRYSSLAFDPVGDPAISYYDATNTDLRSAQLNGGAWYQQLVDGTNEAGLCSSLKIIELPGSAVTMAIAYCSYRSDSETHSLFYTSRRIVEESPSQPWNLLPYDGTRGLSLTLTLQSSVFSDPNGDDDRHVASQWQIRLDSGDYLTPIFDSDRDTSHLGQISIPGGMLEYDTNYWWHVRHQDKYGNWSPWSTETSFATGRPPNQPRNVSPANGANSVSITPTLQSTSFSDPDGDVHLASQWQIRSELGDYTNAVFDSGLDASHLLQVTVPAGVLGYGTKYWWRVVHQDALGNMSEWSQETAFTTQRPPNRPGNVLPANGVGGVSVTPTLQSSAFYDSDGDDHVASQWQIRVEGGDYATPVLDSGRNTANLVLLLVQSGTLDYSTEYWWQVRHQDSYGNWSSYSQETTFATQGRPSQPSSTVPIDGSGGVSITPTLQCSAFHDSDGDAQTASQWQISGVAGDFSSPVFDSGRDSSNLAQIVIPDGILDHGTTYYWRVRYQDEYGNWSDWSSESSLTTIGVAVLVLEPASCSLRPGGSATFVATLRDSHGNPIPGEAIELSANRGSIRSSTDVTDADGRVVFNFEAPLFTPANSVEIAAFFEGDSSCLESSATCKCNLAPFGLVFLLPIVAGALVVAGAVGGYIAVARMYAKRIGNYRLQGFDTSHLEK